MHVQVHDGLAGHFAVVDADVVAVGRLVGVEPAARAQIAANSGSVASVIEAMWRRGMIRVWPWETGNASRIARARSLSRMMRSGGRVQNGQTLMAGIF